MTEAEIRETFEEPEFVEAAGVLEMINQTPEQLQEYRARMKFQMDEIARLDYARQEGELLGRIEVLQEFLGISQPTREELSTYDMAQLLSISKNLQQQMSLRRQ